MTRSIGERSVLLWDRSRVMMFLSLLTHTYAGGGKRLEQSVGLWVDRQGRRPAYGNDVQRVQEGMGLRKALAETGFAWLADKIDWASMVFAPEHRASFLFNAPSVQSSCSSRYCDVVKAKNAFILFHDAFALLKSERQNRRRTRLILQLIVDLCLKAFRMQFFDVIQNRPTNTPLRRQIQKPARARRR